ncbi:MAG: chemotaxis protein CheX [Pirellulales bacterium]
MRAEYINPFISSLTNTFSTMLSQEVTRGEMWVKQDDAPLHEISGVIGLSGKAVGSVVLSLSAELAIKAAAHMLMTDINEVNDDVTDAVGELANMVAGAAKAQLEELNMSVSLPNVITGANHHVRFPSDVKPICIGFACDWGPLVLAVGRPGRRSGKRVTSSKPAAPVY